jgi:hypothetical protein
MYNQAGMACYIYYFGKGANTRKRWQTFTLMLVLVLTFTLVLMSPLTLVLTFVLALVLMVAFTFVFVSASALTSEIGSVRNNQGFIYELEFSDARLLAVLLLQNQLILLPQQPQVLQVIVSQPTDQHHLLVLDLQEM